MTAVLNEHTQFTDTGGKPIVNGKAYFGVRNSDPVTVPITIYSDRNLTTPTANPQSLDQYGRTVNKIWVPARYSVEVFDFNNEMKFQDRDAGSVATAALPQGYVDGWDISINGIDPNHDFDMSIGVGQDDTFTYDMETTSVFTKRIDANWTEGTGVGALDTGTAAADTTYNVFTIFNPTTSITDFIISTSASPAFPTGYSAKLLRGTLVTNSSANIDAVFGVEETISGITFSAGDASGLQSINQTGTWNFRNLFMNGSCDLFQKFITDGASVSVTTDVYTLDRWEVQFDTGAGELAVGQSSDVPAAVFKNSLEISVTSAPGNAADDIASLRQSVEARNCNELRFGTTDANDISIQFWVKPSVSGVMCASVHIESSNLQYIVKFDVVEDVWQHLSAVIAGETGGTQIPYDSTIGITVDFYLMAGVNRNGGTPDQWTTRTSATLTTFDQSNFLPTGASVLFTGLQAEIGPTPTAFEYRPYQIERTLVLRYFEVLPFQSASSEVVTNGFASSTSLGSGVLGFMEKRVAPTASVSAGTHMEFQTAAGNFSSTAVALVFGGVRTYKVIVTASGTPLTAGQGLVLGRDTTDNLWFAFDAEL